MLQIRQSPSGPLVETLDPDVNGLEHVTYVDQLTTVPIDEQTGSPLLPFSTLARAVLARAVTGGIILIAPGDYSAETLPVPSASELSIIFLRRSDSGFSGEVFALVTRT